MSKVDFFEKDVIFVITTFCKTRNFVSKVDFFEKVIFLKKDVILKKT